MAPFVSRCKSNGLFCLVHSGDRGFQKNYSSVKLLFKNLQQEWKKLSVDEIHKICTVAPNWLKAIAEKDGHHME